MNEIIFSVEEINNTYMATAMGRAISIKADSWVELKASAKKAVFDFFENEKHPRSILLRLTREETLTLEG